MKILFRKGERVLRSVDLYVVIVTVSTFTVFCFMKCTHFSFNCKDIFLLIALSFFYINLLLWGYSPVNDVRSCVFTGYKNKSMLNFFSKLFYKKKIFTLDFKTVGIQTKREFIFRNSKLNIQF